MARLGCRNPECPGKKSPNDITLDVSGHFGIKGVMYCLDCGNERSIIVEANDLQELGNIVGEQSKKLTSNVPKDIKEDIRESERAHYAQCYRACVAMCRRALQRSLIEKDIEDKPLSKMLKDALGTSREWHLTQDTYNSAITIKTFADIGLHEAEEIDSEKARITIYIAVQMLNEIFV